jgi:hypothetical protein
LGYAWSFNLWFTAIPIPHLPHIALQHPTFGPSSLGPESLGDDIFGALSLGGEIDGALSFGLQHDPNDGILQQTIPVHPVHPYFMHIALQQPTFGP